METFWNTIASYNAATWPAQLALTLAAVVLTLLLYFRPSPAVRIAMKVFMALLNFWIAGVYYLVCCEPREHHDLLALFWAIMGCIWVYDLAVGHASLQRTGNHKAFAALLFAMPLVYPLFSLLLGRTFPMITSPVWPCVVAVVTIGLLLAFSCWQAASSRRGTSSSANTSATTPGGPRNPRRGCSTRCSR